MVMVVYVRSLSTKAFLIMLCVMVAIAAPSTRAAVIGIDAAHGFDADAVLASGSNFGDFRSILTGLGHTLVPLTSFDAEDLIGLDALILLNNYVQNADPYSPSEQIAVQNFVTRAVGISDSNLFSDPGRSDHPIDFGSNERLLTNSLDWLLSGPGGLLALGDDGTGFDIGNFNELMVPFGIRFDSVPVDRNGHVVTEFVAHPVTSGLLEVGVDFQVPITVSGPALDLTVYGSSDDILAVYVPEPSVGLLILLGLGGLAQRSRIRGRAD